MHVPESCSAKTWELHDGIFCAEQTALILYILIDLCGTYGN